MLLGPLLSDDCARLRASKHACMVSLVRWARSWRRVPNTASVRVIGSLLFVSSSLGLEVVPSAHHSQPVVVALVVVGVVVVVLVDTSYH